MTQSPFRIFPVLIAALLAVVFSATPAAAQRLSDDPASRFSTVPHSDTMQRAIQESELDMVAVLHEGWQETLLTYSRLKLYEITGRTRIGIQDPIYSVLSMTFAVERWRDARIIPIEHPDLPGRLSVEGKFVSPRMIVESPGLNALIEELRRGHNERDEIAQRRLLLDAVEQVHRLGREDRVLNMFRPDNITPEMILELLDNRDLRRQRHAELRAMQRDFNARRPFLDAGERLLGRIQALDRLPEQFLVVPDTESEFGDWIRPVALETSAPLDVVAGNLRGATRMEAGRTFTGALQTALRTNQPELIAPATSEFLGYIERVSLYPDRTYRMLKNYYVANNPWTTAAWVYLLGAAIMGFFLFFRSDWMYYTGVGLFIIGFAYHTAAVVLRYMITGHVPVSNMFEAVTFTSWAVMILAIVYETFSRRGLVLLGAFVMGWLFLTGAGMMPLHETRIHPLRAVLNSYWLNIHVTLMLLSYAALSLAAFFSAIYLIRTFINPTKTSPLVDDPFELFSYRLVQVGWPILTLGITLGAVWASSAWGRYWGWDPKETWAFITWVTYTAYLHSRMVMGWKGRWSAVACLLGFVMMAITWWGVSYLPWFAGGLHSYASSR